MKDHIHVIFANKHLLIKIHLLVIEEYTPERNLIFVIFVEKVCPKKLFHSFIHSLNFSGYRVSHQLTCHMIVHSDVRPYKCNLCTKTFRSRSNLKVHKDEHEGIKRYSCSYCDRKFLVRGNMLKHVRRHIGERPFKCELCEKC